MKHLYAPICLIIAKLLHHSSCYLHQSKLGLLLETNGMVYTYSSHIIEKTHILVPPIHIPEMDLVSQCSARLQDEAKKHYINTYQSMLDQLKLRVDPYRNTLMEINKRKKRFILSLATIGVELANAGLSIYDLYEVSKVESKVNEILNDLEIFRNSQQIEPQNILQMDQSIGKVTNVIIPELMQTVHTIVRDLDCQSAVSVASIHYESQMYDQVLHKVISGLNAIYQNQITPDLFSPAYLRARIINNADMKGSYYSEDSLLLYQLGKFVLLNIEHEPFSISGLLIFPRLLKKHVYTIYTVNKVPIYNQDSELIILDSPKQVAINYDKEHIFPLSEVTCDKHLNNYFCPISEVKSNNESCLHNIVFGAKTSGCQYTIDANAPLIRQGLSGILLSPAISRYDVVHRVQGAEPIIQHKLVFNCNCSQMITEINGTEFNINNRPYLLPLDSSEFMLRNDFKTQIVDVNVIVKKDIDSVLDNHIADIKSLRSLNQVHHASFFLLTVALVMLIIGSVYILKRSFRHRTDFLDFVKIQRGRCIPQNQESEELVPMSQNSVA